MRKLIHILILFLIFSIPNFGGQKKPKIGLLTFSVNAFSEESEEIGKSINAIKNGIKKELNANFDILEELSDVITYSDIELPEVTIAPVVEPEIHKKLEKLSKDLDGVVFGHFHQEDKLVVVTRFYLSKKKYPGIKRDERIISSPEIEISIDSLDETGLIHHTVASIKSLIEELKKSKPIILLKEEDVEDPKKEIISEKIKTSPVDQKDIASESKKEKFEKGTEEVNKPVNSVEKKDIQNKDKEVESKIDYMKEQEPLTASDIYKMVVDKGFYCAIVIGSDFHSEGLKGIKVPGDGIFRDRRFVRTSTDNSGFIKTESVNMDKKKDSEKIVLRWPVKIELGNPRSFALAEAYINNLNKQNQYEKMSWRIPTILELFSIIQGNSKNYFPWIFRYLPKNKDLIFWTSTPVKKEGTILDYDKKNQAYFVIRSSYSKAKDVFSITFAPYNIEGRDKREAFILPVYSEKLDTYKPTSSNTFESIDSYRIPGFDDVSSTNIPIKKIDNIEKKLQPRTIRIALIPYMVKGLLNDIEERELNDINDEIEKDLNKLKYELRRDFYSNLEIIKKSTFNLNDVNFTTLFYSIMSDIKISEGLRMNHLKNRIMIPEKIDIIVTVKKFITSDLVIIQPIIIESLNNDLYKKSYVYNRNKGIPLTLAEYVKLTVRKIVSKSFQ